MEMTKPPTGVMAGTTQPRSRLLCSRVAQARLKVAQPQLRMVQAQLNRAETRVWANWCLLS